MQPEQVVGNVIFMVVCAIAFTVCGWRISAWGHHKGKWMERCRHATCSTGRAYWDGKSACVCTTPARLP